MFKIIDALLVVFIWLSFATSQMVYTNNNSIGSISVSVDVLNVEEENIIVTETVLLADTGSSGMCIPLINSVYEANYGIISITDDQGSKYTGEIRNGCLQLNMQFSQQRFISIKYIINGLIEEISPFHYTLTMNTTGFENITHQVLLSIPKQYVITPILPSGIKVDENKNWFVIEVDKPGIYIFLITVPYETASPRTTSKSFVIPWNTLALVAIVVVGLAMLVLLSFRRREIEVETIPPDVMNDDVARAIIKYIGDRGGGEIKQSELTNVVNRPKSIISRRVKRLEEEGYLEVTPKGRYNLVKLTDKGWRAYRELRKS